VNNNYVVTNQLTENQIVSLLEIYKKDTVWGTTRNLDDVKKMLRNCNFLALINSRDAKEIIGFARFLSDSVYRAMIYDVVVSGKYQGRGFGKLLINILLKQDLLQSVERIELYTRDEKVSFYERLGFKKIATNLMRKV
jgi:ribosomal protein S18 acetylase RimI-like enzyme